MPKIGSAVPNGVPLKKRSTIAHSVDSDAPSVKPMNSAAAPTAIPAALEESSGVNSGRISLRLRRTNARFTQTAAVKAISPARKSGTRASSRVQKTEPYPSESYHSQSV